MAAVAKERMMAVDEVLAELEEHSDRLSLLAEALHRSTADAVHRRLPDDSPDAHDDRVAFFEAAIDSVRHRAQRLDDLAHRLEGLVKGEGV